MLVAIPTDNPGGLDAKRSDHFGHCDIFTLVDLNDDQSVKTVTTVANGGHEAGGCMVPVNVLNEAGAEAIIVGGMGARPMQGFAGAGIKVYFAGNTTAQTAKEVIEKLSNNELPVMHADQVCQGSGNCDH